MLTTNNPPVITQDDDFDVIALENRIEAAYNAKTTPYIDQEIEIDAEYDFGTYFYRVWCGERCLGCFYRLNEKDEWVAQSFYRSGNFINEPREKRFNSHKAAQSYIVKCWKGGKRDV
jgi:hypothetical protein